MWRKSTFSSYTSECVEVGDGVRVRDTADRGGPVLAFTPEAWHCFLASIT